MSLGVFVNVTSRDPAAWEEQLDRVAGLEGLGHVEVWLEELPRTARELRPLVDALSGFRTIAHGPFLGLSLVSSWPELRRISLDRLVEAAAVADAVSAEVMTVHPGIAGSFEDHHVLMERLALSLSVLRSRCTGGPVVAVENMPCRWGASQETLVTVEQCASLIRLDADTRITLDVGHAAQNVDKWQPFLVEHAAAVADVHLHGARAEGRGHLSLVDASSDVTAADFAAAQRAGRYGGFVTSRPWAGRTPKRRSWRPTTRLAFEPGR